MILSKTSCTKNPIHHKSAKLKVKNTAQGEIILKALLDKLRKGTSKLTLTHMGTPVPHPYLLGSYSKGTFFVRTRAWALVCSLTTGRLTTMLQACSRQNHSNANMVALATRYQQIKLQGLHGTRKIANSITFNGTIEGQKLIFKHKKKIPCAKILHKASARQNVQHHQRRCQLDPNTCVIWETEYS